MQIWVHSFSMAGKMKLTNGRNGGHNLAKLQLIQNGGFTSSIESHLRGQAGT